MINDGEVVGEDFLDADEDIFTQTERLFQIVAVHKRFYLVDRIKQ